MEIKTDDYRLWYENETATLNCLGSLRLNGMDEYDPIIQLLESAIDQEPETMILNLKGLEFLNSSGINVLSKFVIKVRQKKNVNLIVKGSTKLLWQGKSLKNLQRLMPSLKLEWE
ncbi:slr1659 superfamily regulator [Laspinema olomoucense]|uniref:STAS domain-containing protein n=1 Tax=Laspinema olomoucense D3b TaxID=2953688 RepID=A0ABT2N8W2_9CYAN|nr:STAS domain-containing protein [Laspinema sp. D3b]MCT7979128.1 hypothetical protein [Laspinema sp. D3b]